MLVTRVCFVMQSLGIIFRITPTLLALTILAWGNSVGDLVSDVTVARQGFAGMGIGACYGVHFSACGAAVTSADRLS